MIRNFFPRDTRLVELCSAFALLTSAVLIYVRVPPPYELLDFHPVGFWAVLMSVFGIVQLVGLLEYPKVEVLRVLVSWFAGVLWVWFSVVTIDRSFGPDQVAVMMLGIGNLYAFTININSLRILWRA